MLYTFAISTLIRAAGDVWTRQERAVTAHNVLEAERALGGALAAAHPHAAVAVSPAVTMIAVAASGCAIVAHCLTTRADVPRVRSAERPSNVVPFIPRPQPAPLPPAA